MQLSPYARTGFAWFARDAKVYAWYWDEAMIDAALNERGMKNFAVHPIPEPLLRQPAADGFSLAKMLDGFEGQFRQQGVIEASAWWPEQPDALEWERFARDVGGQHAGAALPPLEQPDWLTEIPSDMRVVRATSGNSRIDESLVYTAMLVLLGVGAIWLAIGQWRLSSAISERLAERGALRQELGRILDDQHIAERSRAAAETRAANERPFTQLDMLAAVARMGVGDGQKVALSEWDYRNDKLRIVLTTPTAQAPRTELLTRFEQIPGLRNVRLQMESDPKSFSLIADVSQSDESPASASVSPETASSSAGLPAVRSTGRGVQDQ